MPDISAIAGAMQSLKLAGDIAKAMIGLRDGAMISAKIGELNRSLIDAQQSVFAIQQERSTLVDRVRELEEEIARAKAWESEKQRYEVTEMGPGAFARIVKEAMRGAEPPHYVCTNCYDNGKASILQRSETGMGDLMTCPGCTSKVLIRHGYQPPGTRNEPAAPIARASRPAIPRE